MIIMLITHRIRAYIKQQDTPLSRILYRVAKWFIYGQLPDLAWIYRPIYVFYRLVSFTLQRLLNIFLYLPMLQARLEHYCPGLSLENGFPLIQGPIKVFIGDNTCLNGALSIHGHPDSGSCEIRIGENCYIGWQTGISVGKKVLIGDNVMIAGRTSINAHSGHSPGLDKYQPPVMADLVIEDDVWICTGVHIVKPVTIGRGSVVASGCVVTKDVPPNVLFAGNPGKVIRTLRGNE